MKSFERQWAWRQAAFMLALVAAALFSFSASAAGAGPATLWTRCDGGEGDVSCDIVRGIASAPASAPVPGAVYIAAQGNASIEEFSAWGVFQRRWGWDVIESGPDDNGTGFEVCMPAGGDLCKAGVPGAGAGQFASPQGVALDSVGNVYVVDRPNHRVQQFSATGQFLRMWGKGVNSGSGSPDLCTSAGPPTDICGPGAEGSGNGQFGAWTILGSYVAVDTKSTAGTSDDRVYVGDQGRIQVFNTSGEYQSQIVEGLSPSEAIKALAVDKAGNLYAAIAEKNNVRKWNSSGVYQGESVTVKAPQALAADPADKGNNLYVVSGPAKAVIARFSSTGIVQEEWGQEEPPAPKIDNPTGIAAGSACFAKGRGVYVTNADPFFARAYGERPTLCPKPEVAPTILTQYATAADVFTATLKAQINPHFYDDTAYYAQYATAACIDAGGWAAACVKARPDPPGTGLGVGGDAPIVTAGILVTELEPDTSYRFRFVARSGGGGPVAGAEGNFHTLAAPSSAFEVCSNAIFRIEAAASLPDCRAYEMVSPIDKEGADIRSLGTPDFNPVARNQSAVSGQRLAYTAVQAFGGAESQSFVSQYIAERGSAGWSTEAIVPPRGVLRGGAAAGSDNQFKAFSADLCESWLVTDDTTAPALAPGGLGGTNNLYRRQNCGGRRYEALGSGKVKGNELELQGASADGSVAVFRTEAHQSQEAGTQVGITLKCVTPTAAKTISYQWLSNGTPIGGAGKAEYTIAPADAGKILQCQVTAVNPNAGAVSVNNPAWAIDPYPTSAPPLAPQSIAAPTTNAPLQVGGAGGQTLSCEAGEWGGSPSFAYRWYRNGAQIAEGPQPTYTVQASDLLNNAAFQCGVVATNGGSSVVATSASLATSPAPDPAGPQVEARGEENPAMTYITDGERLRPVCVLPGGRKASPGCSAGLVVSSLDIGYGTNLDNAISADGKKVYWTADSGLGFGGKGKIYLRNNAGQPQSALDGEGKCTEANMACTIPVSQENAQFWAASADGRKAIYRTGDIGVEKPGTLYEFDASSGQSGEIAGGVLGLLGTSEDAARIYLVSTEALDGKAVPGAANLYLYDSAGGGSFAFIASLPGAEMSLEAGPQDPSPVSLIPGGHAARVTPSGNAVAFVSTGRLTGYDNSDATSGEADREVFLYRMATGRLECVSCNPNGARPAGRHREENGKNYWSAGEITGAEHPLYFARNLSEDGARLFFESYVQLVLADTNGKRDVYQWEAAGKGGCSAASTAFSAAAGGCVSLISSGKSTLDSEFTDASPSGDDAFIRSAESLVPSDPGQFDVYDARVGGGFPQPGIKPPCEGDACQTAASAPEALSPASSAFHGKGNLAPGRRCPPGKRKVRRHGKQRCERKHQHRAHRHQRRHHGREHRNHGRAQR